MVRINVRRHIAAAVPTIQQNFHDDVFACGQFVRDELRGRAEYYDGHPQAAFDLASQWDAVFRETFERVKNRPRASSDIDKVLEEVKEEVSPVKWAEDHLVDAMAKRYLARLAPLLDFLASAPTTAIGVFLTPSDTASDLDELNAANREVQSALSAVTNRLLRSDWKMNYATILQRVPLPAPRSPEIRSPS
jgi:hypothetical protein